MVKLAQDMMAGMSPEQIRQMQEQASKLNPSQVQEAMETMKKMTPEQRAEVERMAKKSNPEDLLRQSEAHVSAQQTYAMNAAEQLKNEGNVLFKAGRYTEAVDKYQRALENVSAAEGAVLKKSCHSNLASCYLHVEEWSKCISHCDTVLEIDGGRNMKALYRRGQAYIGLKRKGNAVADLQRALVLAGPEDGALIEVKLRAAKALEDEQVKETVIEEVEMVEETIIEEIDGTVEETVVDSVKETVGTHQTTAGVADQQNMFAKDPNTIKNAAKMLQDMDPETVEQMMKMSGAPPGMAVNPEQLKMAAKMMENMSAEDIQRMQDMSRSFASSTPSSSNGATPGAPTMPSSIDDMRKMAQNPEMLKHMQQMLKGMDPESLCTMMKSAGVNVNPEQAKKMQDQLSSLSDTQVERLAKVASVLGTAVSYYQRLKAYIRQNPAMVFAIIVLIIAVYLRYKGII